MRSHKIALIIALLMLICALPVQATEVPPTWPTVAWRTLAPFSNKIASHVWDTIQEQPTVEILVILTTQADGGFAAAAHTLTTPADKGRFVYQTLFSTAQHTQAPLRAWLTERHISHRAFYIINALWVEADLETLLTLAIRPDVARIVANPRIAQARLPDSPPAPQLRTPNGIEWGINQIGAPQIWDLGHTGEGIVIAGQDTGYDWDHPALKNQYRGWNGTSANHDYNWHDAIHSGGGSCGADSPEPCDDYGHGTHTLGTMVGDDGGSNQIGVAPGAEWIACRNMDRGYGTPARYIECFEFFLAPYPVAGTAADGDPSQAPDIINNSWSCPASEGCDWTSLQATVETVRAAGIMIVASASNYGSACHSVREPIALYESVYSIGATDSSDNIASFSSRGSVTIDGSGRLKPDLSAPGMNTRSSVPGGGYGNKSGTSMAAPHVAGAVALLWSAVPDLHGDITATQNLLNATAVPRYSTQCEDAANTVPNNVYGWGRLDVWAAVQHTQQFGWLTGTVRTVSGTPLSGVLITAMQSKGTQWSTTTTEDGSFSLPLNGGTYTVFATLPYYHNATYFNVIITPEQMTALTITLHCNAVGGTAFMWTPEEIWANTPVTLTGTVTQGALPVTYTWYFTDTSDPVAGNPVTYTFPVHETAMMPYPVILTATNMCSQQTISQTVQVHNPYMPCYAIAGLTFTHTLITLHPQQVVTWTATVLTGTLPITYTWHFNATPELVVGNPVTHTFPAHETASMPYPIVLTATNACSQQTISQTVQVHNPYTPCYAIASLTFTHTPITLHPQQVVTWTATVLTGTLPITYTWHFSATPELVVGNPVTHTFPAHETTSTPYSIVLTVTNACSQQTISQTVQVHNPYTPCYTIAGLKFTHTPISLPPQQMMILTARVVTGSLPISYTWQLGSDLHLSGNPITHTRPASASLWQPYTVVVTATNLCSTQTYTTHITMTSFRVYLPLIMRVASYR